MRRVVITGIGVVSSIGANAAETTEALREGRSGVTFAEEFAEHGFRCQVYARPKVDVEAALDRRVRRFMGEGAAWNYIAMQEAIADARLAEDEISHPRTGIIMGSGGPSTRAIVEAADKTRETGGTRKIGPTIVPKAMSSTNSATLAVPFKILGVNYSISSACATSVHCIGAAAEQIIWGKQDVMFAGGGEELDWTMSNLFDAMGAMSTNFNDRPSVASRAYDRDRDGFVIAGGAGVVVLEERERAIARGAEIYGEIVGYYANSDGYDMVQLSGEGAVRCMKGALETVRQPIDYINTHGTSTPVGDSKETQAIRETFGDRIPPFSSTKSLTGHSLGAVGAQETIYCLLMMKHDFIAASAHIETLDPEFEGLPIVRERIDNAKIDCFLTNSFGFGGTNGCLVVARHDG
ncbi:beta-ketoacyl-ACP synthase I [Amphiplicatus metriothermophilus]|uniref:3-oxoacyl-[acyl-carrier-protein] synthase 1 n=1 Tax=Amphiplicatus metriothermophilus TaxID=1519374 RepID=A0A239PK00_9PROT|nr:beta-ketoacyl-ACP synthase I [Amphiplicatus metriothermophilus]MBB5517539.1 3-oxoacyl-[acyl-carrier-protein] synthase-1 [Amphiplicatus metriothermophilus]SNT68126.1 3-oxoacyl-[acyl-carrier-protein] synthase I [Amphiplicatus metriothermophilus]